MGEKDCNEPNVIGDCTPRSGRFGKGLLSEEMGDWGDENRWIDGVMDCWINKEVDTRGNETMLLPQTSNHDPASSNEKLAT